MDQENKDTLVENAIDTASEFGFFEVIFRGICGFFGLIFGAIFD